MRIIKISDLHGKKIWEDIVAKEEATADKIVFDGDYFDSFTIPFIHQLHNFNKIIEYKKANPDKVVLLFGNHDFHYLRAAHEDYSGYQFYKALDIQDVMEAAIKENLIQMCYVNDIHLFIHAGVSKTWAAKNLPDLTKNNDVEAAINRLFIENPASFGWVRDKYRYTDPFGDNVYQGPLWIRPKSILKDKIDGFIQIVGHTHQKKLILSNDVILTDVFDTVNKYLILDDRNQSIGQII